MKSRRSSIKTQKSSIKARKKSSAGLSSTFWLSDESSESFFPGYEDNLVAILLGNNCIVGNVNRMSANEKP